MSFPNANPSGLLISGTYQDNYYKNNPLIGPNGTTVVTGNNGFNYRTYIVQSGTNFTVYSGGVVS